MLTSVSRFQTAFVGAKGDERAQIVFLATKRNSKEAEIIKLLSVINFNDVSVRNNTNPDNIYFICGQLRSFPKFVY
jgi:hypothetical protein